MANFVAVPTEAIKAFMEAKQFRHTVQRQEVVYVRTSKRNPNVHIKVYTSITVGRTAVRGAGKDAIRVCVVFDSKARAPFGIGKFPPVLRVASVESVLERLGSRLQDAAKRANEWMDQNPTQAEMARRVVSAIDERLEEKAEFARIEAEQEARAFMNDPDMKEYCGEEPGDDCPESERIERMAG
jgi:hypothetical protein